MHCSWKAFLPVMEYFYNNNNNASGKDTMNYDQRDRSRSWVTALTDRLSFSDSSTPDINHNTGSPIKSFTKENCSLDSNFCGTFGAKSPSKRRSTDGSTSNFSAISTGDDSAFLSPAYNEALYLTTGLCRDYVCFRLRRSGFTAKVYVTEFPPASNQRLSNQILNIGNTFETFYPNLHKNLSRKIGYIFDSEATLRRLYYRLGSHVIGFDSRNITWGRILSLLCLAGAMAVDCVAQGHSELVEPVIKISSDFLKQNVLEWVMDRGGWQTMSSHFAKNRNSGRNAWLPVVSKNSLFSITVATFLVVSILMSLVINYLF